MPVVGSSSDGGGLSLAAGAISGDEVAAAGVLNAAAELAFSFAAEDTMTVRVELVASPGRSVG